MNLFEHLEREMIQKERNMNATEAVNYAREVAKQIARREGPQELPKVKNQIENMFD